MISAFLIRSPKKEGQEIILGVPFLQSLLDLAFAAILIVRATVVLRVHLACLGVGTQGELLDLARSSVPCRHPVAWRFWPIYPTNLCLTWFW